MRSLFSLVSLSAVLGLSSVSPSTIGATVLDGCGVPNCGILICPDDPASQCRAVGCSGGFCMNSDANLCGGGPNLTCWP